MTQLNLATSTVESIDTEDRVRVLGIIDQLRELGVNEEISLPQLVVVGDQSSGKSSLLEGLTGLSFPIASELCTRFATQIVLRRTPVDEGTVKVSIIPGPSANNDEAQKKCLQSFERYIHGSELSADDFAEILDSAAAYMGLPTKDEDIENISKRFSDDILKIELSGPNHHHLSVVDVPGLFHNPTKYQTEEDKGIIRSLLESYVADRRTIILAVMDARNNLANQEVFRMARKADEAGARTVGIITKCDALQKGDERGVLNIAQNYVERLTHGWFCVRNRSTEEIQRGDSIEDRHRTERNFFATSPWNTLSKDRVGIPSLSKFLGKLLYDHIRGEFPALVQEIRDMISECREKLEGMGEPRQTTYEQRQFLTRLAARYQNAVTANLKGDYESKYQADDARKLRMHLQAANENFADKLIRFGHSRIFQTIEDEPDKEYEECEDDESIYEWIRRIYRESRGSELPGTLNPTILELMFRQQAQNWRKISMEHVAYVDRLVSEFNEELFEDLISEESLRIKIGKRNGAPARNAKAQANKQLELLLGDEMGGILQTVNHYFAETLSATREERVIHRLQKLAAGDEDIRLAAAVDAVHLSNEDQAVFDIHDILKSYYKVALKRFTDNVVLQVVERCYLGSEGPVKYISPEFVGQLRNDELMDIAAENYATSNVRNETTTRLERMEKALAIAEMEG